MSLSGSLLDSLLWTLLYEHVAASIGCCSAEDNRIAEYLRLQIVGCPELSHSLDPRGSELHLLRALLLKWTQQLRRWHRSLRDLDALLSGGCGLLLSQCGNALLLTCGRDTGADFL